ncbi:hypothetical protein LSH36_4g12043 [Paralvinella palmiformis]|uniref:Carbohydrate sulfotransferase n=1 Tax=Paralvinella palmiformis TaxID=53620 RepID=A0AAD9NHE1_9ANNE|nr:hypothetical protein LSH36_4g12043 [Paralvinella palmiformis]
MQDKVSNFKCLLKSPACLRLGTMSSASLTCYRCLCAFTGVLPKRKMTKLTYSILAIIAVGLLLIGMYRLSEFSRGPLKIGFLTVCPQDIRRRYIKEACSRMNVTRPSKPPYLKHIVIDHWHKLAYCLIPKVGSRTIRTILGALLTRNASYVSGMDFPRIPGISILANMPPSLQQQVMEKYKKMIVVRHPYDRLLSVFDSKLLPTHREMVVELLAKNVRQINKYFSDVKGKETSFDPNEQTLSFEEFVGVISSQYNAGFRDRHWKTMFEHCDPCTIEYDFVLRLETLAKDYRVLSSYLHPPKWLTNSAPYLEQMKTSLLNPEEKMFNLLWRYENIDSVSLEGLKNVYEKDLGLFGYTWDVEKGANCRIPLGDGTYCC